MTLHCPLPTELSRGDTARFVRDQIVGLIELRAGSFKASAKTTPRKREAAEREAQAMALQNTADAVKSIVFAEP